MGNEETVDYYVDRVKNIFDPIRTLNIETPRMENAFMLSGG